MGGRITATQMRVLVATQADGHWQTELAYGRELRFGLTKDRKIVRLRRLLKAARIPWREAQYTSHPGETTFRIRRVDYPPWLTPERKIFGSWLLDSSFHARQAFLDELVHWD